MDCHLIYPPTPHFTSKASADFNFYLISFVISLNVFTRAASLTPCVTDPSHPTFFAFLPLASVFQAPSLPHVSSAPTLWLWDVPPWLNALTPHGLHAPNDEAPPFLPTLAVCVLTPSKALLLAAAFWLDLSFLALNATRSSVIATIQVWHKKQLAHRRPVSP